MNRPYQIWVVFGGCLMVVLAAMGGISWLVVDLDEREWEARRRAEIQEAEAQIKADREEDVRIAKWRMYSLVSSVKDREDSRPFYVYRAFYKAQLAYTRMYTQIRYGDVLVPSPLLGYESPFVKLHFQFDSEGGLSSPQAPTGNMLDLAQSRFDNDETIDRAQVLLSDFGRRVNVTVMRQAAPRPRVIDTRPMSSNSVVDVQRQVADIWQAGVKGNLDGFNYVWNGARMLGVPTPSQSGRELRQIDPVLGRNDKAQQEERNRKELEKQYKQSIQRRVLSRARGNSTSQYEVRRPKLVEPSKPAPIAEQSGGKTLAASDGIKKLSSGISNRWKLFPGKQVDKKTPALDALGGVLGEKDREAKRDGRKAGEDRFQRGVGPMGFVDVREGEMVASWVGDELVFVRRVQVNGREYVQGCWLDWGQLEQQLRDEVDDLLPDVELVPVRDVEGMSRLDPALILANLPARLEPAALKGVDLSSLAMGGAYEVSQSVKNSLMAAWGFGVFAVLAVVVLLRGTLGLSERRGAFVSAVTHELRTPLTTFRMYTQMLDDGMVKDEEKRDRYVSTLRVEADRLGHLVENVLSYARLERGSASKRVEEVAVGDLLDRLTERWAQRTEEAEMALHVEAECDAGDAMVNTDTTAVDQILFNLVDNACKYGGGGVDRRIEIGAVLRGRDVELRVRDYGVGIARSEGKRLFQPFSKSAKAAAGTAPGVGLGLALSRRLAKSLGGDLFIDFEKEGVGTCFVLRLPLKK